MPPRLTACATGAFSPAWHSSEILCCIRRRVSWSPLASERRWRSPAASSRSPVPRPPRYGSGSPPRTGCSTRSAACRRKGRRSVPPASCWPGHAQHTGRRRRTTPAPQPASKSCSAVSRPRKPRPAASKNGRPPPTGACGTPRRSSARSPAGVWRQSWRPRWLCCLPASPTLTSPAFSRHPRWRSEARC